MELRLPNTKFSLNVLNATTEQTEKLTLTLEGKEPHAVMVVTRDDVNGERLGEVWWGKSAVNPEKVGWCWNGKVDDHLSDFVNFTAFDDLGELCAGMLEAVGEFDMAKVRS